MTNLYTCTKTDIDFKSDINPIIESVSDFDTLLNEKICPPSTTHDSCASKTEKSNTNNYYSIILLLDFLGSDEYYSFIEDKCLMVKVNHKNTLKTMGTSLLSVTECDFKIKEVNIGKRKIAKAHSRRKTHNTI
ncbi:hypothetical protein AYI68_g602 [Smittium mucronatum]|uniref:Uncharacterized protein n=1 Tax=Smittium mucronatum TaxID=133383 RepID=A0A1R0H7U3_9FUNG|nr:hypothetical protein AYI68_g602 [Smittium mucronatum]